MRLDNSLITGSLSVSGSLRTSGTITAQTLVVQTVTSSISLITGSTQWGSTVSNTHQFTGSMSISGSLTSNGALTLNTANNQIRSGNELRFYRADNGIYTQLYDSGSGTGNGFVLDNTNGEGFHFKNATTSIMRLTSTNNVSIGTVTPVNSAGYTRLLNVYDAASAAVGISIASNDYQLGVESDGGFRIRYNGTQRFLMSNTGAATFSGSVTAAGNITISNTLNAYAYQNFGANSGYGWQIGKADNSAGIAPSNGFYIYDLTNSATRFVISQSGNVGIGTTSPGQQLVVSGSGADTRVEIGSTTTQGIYFTKNGANNGTFRTNTNGDFEFYTKTVAQAVVISSAGDLTLSGTSTLYAYTTTAAAYGIVIQNTSNNTSAKAMRFRGWDASETGNISTYVNLTTYNTTSDYRLKEDLKDFNGLDLVSRLKMYDFKWKTADWRMYGGLAHEMQEVIPYAVTGEKDGEDNQTADYSTLVPVLVKAIQELNTKLDAANAEIEALKAK